MTELEDEGSVESVEPQSVIEIDSGADIDEDDGQIDEYQLSSSPNDFNVLTIINFIESGAITIPGFQRQYVWDLKRASKLIESLIIGLPIPQIFLYEENQNNFLVIDGQQRLLSLYFFAKSRFPRKQWRSEMRSVFNAEGRIPEQLLRDDKFFQNFNLSLPKLANGQKNKFHGLNYATLGDYQATFGLRTIRNVIVRQIKPSDDDSSIYEMFNRLNTGGVNLRPQEIRASLYHSAFYDVLFELNADPEWRRLLGSPNPDLHMNDIQVLLRAMAMFGSGDNYKPSMASFLNRFSKDMKEADEAEVERYRVLTTGFLRATRDVDPTLFQTRSSGFSVLAFESIFQAALLNGLEKNPNLQIDPASVRELREDPGYRKFTEAKTGDSVNVRGRLSRARQLIRLS
jgi:hypothetical protein